MDATIDWELTWTTIIAIGTVITALGIPITATIALLSWRRSNLEKKEKYFLDRQSLSNGILAELNSNENLMKYLKLCKIIKNGDKANFAQSTSNGDYILDYNGIFNIFLYNLNNESFNYFKQSGISYKKFGIIFDLTFIYKKIEMIKKLLTFMLNEMDKESSQFIGNSSIRFATSTLEQIRDDININLKKINEIYILFKEETNFDFLNREYYRSFESLILRYGSTSKKNFSIKSNIGG